MRRAGTRADILGLDFPLLASPHYYIYARLGTFSPFKNLA